MFEIFGALFFLMFIAVFGLIAFTIAKSISQWNRNNHAPRLTVPARVVAKRANVSHHHHGGDMHHSSSSTSYYVTFEVSSGDRMELHMAGSQYGLIVEGDYGDLTFQGTRYISFERKVQSYDI